METCPEAPPSLLSRLVALGGVLFAIFYLVNPTGGWVEFLPDALPLVGNLDEAAMTALLLHCLRHLGVELLPRGRTSQGRPAGAVAGAGEAQRIPARERTDVKED